MALLFLANDQCNDMMRLEIQNLNQIFICLSWFCCFVALFVQNQYNNLIKSKDPLKIVTFDSEQVANIFPQSLCLNAMVGCDRKGARKGKLEIFGGIGLDLLNQTFWQTEEYVFIWARYAPRASCVWRCVFRGVRCLWGVLGW